MVFSRNVDGDVNGGVGFGGEKIHCGGASRDEGSEYTTGEWSSEAVVEDVDGSAFTGGVHVVVVVLYWMLVVCGDVLGGA